MADIKEITEEEITIEATEEATEETTEDSTEEMTEEKQKADFKEEIKQRWEESAEGYHQGITNELGGEKREDWKKLILMNAPQKEGMKILDIGTGPGFFPVILGEEGHFVTGIDLTENMLKFAEKNAKDNGVEAEFIRMDCTKPEFPDETFDLIICRNLTWILTEPEDTYREWQRILKKDGRILIFDANWNSYLFDDDIRKKREENLNNVREKYGFASHDHLDQDEVEEEGRRLPMGRFNRPAWDLDTFIKLGFKYVVADTDISDKIPFSEKELMEYEGITPQFMVGAQK